MRSACTCRQVPGIDALLDALSEPVLAVDHGGVVVIANDAATRLLGYDTGQLVGAPVARVLRPLGVRVNRARRQDGSVLDVDIDVIDAGDDERVARTVVLRPRRRPNRPGVAPVPDSGTDATTGVLTRQSFEDMLNDALTRATSAERGVGLLCCRLDRFDLVQEALGREHSDDLLRHVAHRISESLRASDQVARFGGDEFFVLCDGITGVDEAREISHRIERAIERPLRVWGQSAFVDVRIGIAFGDHRHKTCELLRHARIASAHAKLHGVQRVEVFDDSVAADEISRLRTEHELRDALRHGQLRCRYQPIVDIEHEKIMGFEALVRWHHPRRGTVAPGAFIGIAEETGLVVPMGTHVLATACAEAAGWARDFPDDPPRICVNVSPRQLADADFVPMVRDTLDATGLPPARLYLEVTESAVLDDLTLAASLLGELRELGVNIAIDDFGTGRSALEYLFRLPVDLVKIDQSFVHGLGVEEAATKIIGSVIDLAHRLGLRTAGEGVETVEQLRALRELGCDLAQGFLFASPLAGDHARMFRRHLAAGPAHASTYDTAPELASIRSW